MESIVVWSIILVASIVIECMTTALVSIWFVPSAAVCIVLELFNVSIYIQIAVFVVLTALLVFLLRNKIKSGFSKNSTKTNVDSLIGKTAVVEEEIPEGAVGRVKVGGMSWAAFSKETRAVLAGEKVKIIEVSGVKLCCAPLEEKPFAPDSALIGKQARVERKIDNFEASGTVVCEGKAYLAKSVSNDIIDENTIVKITDISDGRVVCEKLLSMVK